MAASLTRRAANSAVKRAVASHAQQARNASTLKVGAYTSHHTIPHIRGSIVSSIDRSIHSPPSLCLPSGTTGVIGAGRIGRVHLETLASVPGVQPVILSDVVEPVLKEVRWSRRRSTYVDGSAPTAVQVA